MDKFKILFATIILLENGFAQLIKPFYFANGETYDDFFIKYPKDL